MSGRWPWSSRTNYQLTTLVWLLLGERGGGVELRLGHGAGLRRGSAQSGDDLRGCPCGVRGVEQSRRAGDERS
jgi:hypothetical protein